MVRENWDEILFDKKQFKGVIKNNKNVLEINGEIKNPLDNLKKIKYWAADPSNYRYSYSGSGLPFNNQEQAYTNKINVGEVDVVDSKFSFKIYPPNSYYTKLNTNLIKPMLHITTCNSNYESIKISNEIPYRYLNHPAHVDYFTNFNKIYKPSGELFYTNIDNLPYRNQEQILRDSAYPKKNVMPKNFWGLKPSL